MPKYEQRLIVISKVKVHEETILFLQNSGSENLCPEIKAPNISEKIP